MENPLHLPSSILDRFIGPDGPRRVLESLRSQTIVEHSEEVATRLTAAATIEKYESGTVIIRQDDATNDLYFILAGSVSTIINGREINRRKAGEAVGEMGAIDTHARRSASIIARSETVVARVAEPDFAKIANEFPAIWRKLASQLAERLRQRNSLVPLKNDTPRVFIGSSSEGLEVARAIQTCLHCENVEIRLWTDGVFRASRSTIEDLERQAATIDFGILVLSPDDQIASRGTERMGPRDNVIFEFGMLLGAIGRERTFSIQPHGVDMKIPSDLLGIKSLSYLLLPDEILQTAISPACNELRDVIRRMGAR